jgi:riboflavin kinase/FMN adenylyltransferase
MQILHGLDGLLQVPRRSVMSVGNFDGVHLGHQRIFKTARDVAAQRKAELVFVTFEPHPLTVLRPQAVPPRLTPPDVKRALLQAQGADYLVVLPPEKSVLDLTAEDFWNILKNQVAVSDLVEGASFRFGRGALGTVPMLGRWSASSNVKLHVAESVQVSLLDLQIATVSSSVIRFLLTFGRVRDAAICLGRPHALSGAVQKGFARGKSLGVPTANLKCDDQLIPADGVYVGRCAVAGRVYPAAVSIGTMPTFGDCDRQIEAHLVGFDGDLYGTALSVEMVDWIRPQRAYDGIEPLMRQIQKDIAQTVRGFGRDSSRPIASTRLPASNLGRFA